MQFARSIRPLTVCRQSTRSFSRSRIYREEVVKVVDTGRVAAKKPVGAFRGGYAVAFHPMAGFPGTQLIMCLNHAGYLVSSLGSPWRRLLLRTDF
jgi:hypothetical protein